MSQHKHLYDKQAWKRKRVAQLQQQPLCVMCQQQAKTTAATVADHVTPHRGDESLFWHGELQSLCATCHSKHKQRQEASGTLAGGDATGRPSDPNHHWNR